MYGIYSNWLEVVGLVGDAKTGDLKQDRCGYIVITWTPSPKQVRMCPQSQPLVMSDLKQTIIHSNRVFLAGTGLPGRVSEL